MANNMFISYDLHRPGQNYDDVIAAIKANRSWAKVHYSLFYVSTTETAAQVAKAVWAKMDPNDKLLVIDATHNDAYWYNLPNDVAEFIKNHWVR